MKSNSEPLKVVYPNEFQSRRATDAKAEKKCLHESCGDCHGSGRKQDGRPCVHMLSCPCPKCSPVRM